MPGEMLGVTALVNGARYEFGALGVDAARQLDYSARIQSDDGDYDVTLSLDCDG